MDATTVIEINGVKMEVDLHHAKQVYNNLRVGSRVKVFDKEYNSGQIFHGVIIGFENFIDMPTIVVCALAKRYGDYELKFFNINCKGTAQLVPAVDWYPDIEKHQVLSQLDKAIERAQLEIKDLEAKRNFFVHNFETYFNNQENE